jgi:selenocysteine-specific elongation factor
VDRAFSMTGLGTVVTGTVLSGTADVESELELHPANRRVRVRGVQVHGRPARKASAGERAAINLSGVEVSEAARGSVLVRPSCFRETTAADCVVELSRALKNRAPVHFHSGTAETVAEIRALDGSATIEVGEAAVRLVFQEALVLAPGDRFIVRMFSPVTTIGGGEVVDPFPPAGLRLNRALERTRALAGSTMGERIRILVAEAANGLSQAELMIRTGLTEGALAQAVPAEVAVLKDGGVWYIDRERGKAAAAQWHQEIAAFHRANPLLPGIPREDFRSRNAGGASAAVFEFLLTQDPTLRVTGEFIHLSSHKLALKADEERAMSSIESAFRSAGLAVPGLDEVLNSTGVDRTRARNLLQVLLREKRLVRISEDLVFSTAAIEELRQALLARQGTRFGVAEFKEWTGVSRKYAIPLLEYFDRERVTRRDGDSRLILPRS